MPLSSHDKLQPGQPYDFSARKFNAFVDAASLGAYPSGQRPSGQGDIQYTPIRIYSGSRVEAGSAVGFGSPKIIAEDNTHALEDVVFESATPKRGRWAVAQHGIDPTEWQECALVGLAWAQVDVQDADHEWADVRAGTLESGDSGYAKIIYKPETLGVQWCCLHLGFAATAATGGCCCELLDLLEKSLPLTDPYNDSITIGDRIGQLQAAHGCRKSVPCQACSTGEAPSSIGVTITGCDLAVAFAKTKTAEWLNPGSYQEVRQAFSDLVNREHRITLGTMHDWAQADAQGRETVLHEAIRYGSSRCTGNVVYQHRFDPLITNYTLNAAVTLSRIGSRDSSESWVSGSGLWAVQVSFLFSKDEDPPADALQWHWVIRPSTTPGSALWEDDCDQSVFADHNDLNPFNTYDYQPETLTAGLYPFYAPSDSPALLQWSVGIDGSQSSTPPPPPPE